MPCLTLHDRNVEHTNLREPLYWTCCSFELTGASSAFGPCSLNDDEYMWNVPDTCPTREVTRSHVEGIHHAHADQDILHVILLLHLESRQPHLDLNVIHHVWARPLLKVLIGQRLLQLGVDTKTVISLSASCAFLYVYMCVSLCPTFSRPVVLSSNSFGRKMSMLSSFPLYGISRICPTEGFKYYSKYTLLWQLFGYVCVLTG